MGGNYHVSRAYQSIAGCIAAVRAENRITLHPTGVVRGRLRRRGAIRLSLARRRTLARSYRWYLNFLMHYVYLLRSESHSKQQYIDLTGNLRQRSRQHNEEVCRIRKS